MIDQRESKRDDRSSYMRQTIDPFSPGGTVP
jgi:hypothetical protein